MKHEDIHLAKASGLGNKVILYGAHTGGDGMRRGLGVGVRDLHRHRPHQAPQRAGRRPVHGETAHRVHAGGPRGRTGRGGIQDLGGAGISCATSELASNGDGGMDVELDLVPLRTTLSPERSS